MHFYYIKNHMLFSKFFFLFFHVYMFSFLMAPTGASTSSEECISSQTSAHIKASLTNLEEATKAKKIHDCRENIEVLGKQLDLTFPHGQTIDSSIRPYLHDIRHYLILLTTHFAELSPTLLSEQDEKGEILPGIINNLKQLFSKLYQGDQPIFLYFNPTHQKIETTLEGITYLIKHHAKEKSVNFQYHYEATTPGTYIAENEKISLAIKQILFNLLHNAVHYTSQAQEREVRLEAIITENPNRANAFLLRCTICDTGAGISSDDVKKLFTPGFRGDKETTFTGSGTGLAACKKLADEIGGEIVVTSPGKNKGASFWFTAPVVVEGMAHNNSSSSITITRKMVTVATMKVLIVDDSPIMHKLLKREIIQSIPGISETNIKFVQNGNEDLIRNDEYDLVFMDMDLGSSSQMNGLQVTRAIRNRIKRKNGNQPVIFSISSNTDKESMEQAREAGIDDFFSKLPQDGSKKLTELLNIYFAFEEELPD